MIILTMSIRNSWILKEQELNWAMLENKLLTATSNLFPTEGTLDGATREEYSLSV
jgi:hypothetical protein